MSRIQYRGRQYIALPYRPRPPLPGKVKRDAEEALRWLAEQPGVIRQLLDQAEQSDLWDDHRPNRSSLSTLESADHTEYLFAPAFPRDILERVSTWKQTAYWDRTKQDLQELFDATQEAAQDDYYGEEEYRRYVEPIADWIQQANQALVAFDRWVESVEAEHQYSTNKAKQRQDGDAWPPGIEDVETLWHVTTNAPAVAQTGLKSRQQLEQEGADWAGIGGSATLWGEGMDAGISFTGSREWANEIRDWYLDSMELFSSDPTVADVKRYAASFGLFDEGVEAGWNNLVEAAADSGVDVDWTDDSARLTVNETAQVWKMIHLWSCSLDQKFCIATHAFAHGNQLAKVLTSGDESRIGIVEAEIDMTNTSIIYLRGEEEFRVPADAILDWKMVS